MFFYYIANNIINKFFCIMKTMVFFCPSTSAVYTPEATVLPPLSVPFHTAALELQVSDVTSAPKRVYILTVD
jgi:hypothetical protein